LSTSDEVAQADPGHAGLPRGLKIVLGLGATTLAVAGMKAAAGIIAPTVLGIILVLTVAPARGWLLRKAAPGWAAALATILLVYAILAGMIVALVVSAVQLAGIVPQYSDQFSSLVDDVGAKLGSMGLQPEQVDALHQAFDPSKLVGLLTSLASSAVGIVTLIVFVATLVLFIGFDAIRFPANLRAARTERPAIVDAVGTFAKATRTYMSVTSLFGLIVAVIDSLALWAMGIPGALVWGVLSFVTNFIPNIGFVIGVIPPAIIALLEGGPTLMIWVIVVYSVINFVIQSIIQPKYQGDALGLSTTLTFLSLIFWAWVLGPLGAILALPLTMLVKAVFVDVDPDARWLGPLLSGAPLVEVASLGSDDVENDAAAPPPPA
jgi:AI-2 transport protein TqsA